MGAYSNVNGGPLERCSGAGMALTGFTRNGHCVDENDDEGSHHICIDMASNTGKFLHCHWATKLVWLFHAVRRNIWAVPGEALVCVPMGVCKLSSVSRRM